jgi:hypothetical protein
VLVFGLQVQKLHSDTTVGVDVDLSDVKTRVGQPGMLYWDERTSMVKNVASDLVPFSYDTSDITQDFATREFVQSAPIGSFVGLVLRVHQAEECETNEKQEPYLSVRGVDMDGQICGPIRLWRWTEHDADMHQDGVYIIRGLKVMKETEWSNEKWAYVPREDGTQTLESSFRVAVEDVSQVQDITQYFS